MFDSLTTQKGTPVIDLLCVLPVAQQVIGLSGGLLSLIKLTGNVANRTFKEVMNFAHSNPKMKAFREGNDKARNEHLNFLAINTIRIIPIAGSVLSFERLLLGIPFMH